MLIITTLPRIFPQHTWNSNSPLDKWFSQAKWYCLEFHTKVLLLYAVISWNNTFFGTHFLQASNLSVNSEEYECQFCTGKAFVVFLIQNSFSNKEHVYTKKKKKNLNIKWQQGNTIKYNDKVNTQHLAIALFKFI